MSKKVDGMVAVVTGGSVGIGLGIAKALADEGAQVFMSVEIRQNHREDDCLVAFRSRTVAPSPAAHERAIAGDIGVRRASLLMDPKFE